MQAATIAAFGDLNVLNFGEAPTPPPKSHHVLIKIEAVGTNYYDTLVRSGAVSRTIPLPHVIGSDVVGHIGKLGAEGSDADARDARCGASWIALWPKHRTCSRTTTRARHSRWRTRQIA
jgi:NADPH:quinone reductase-like Zn-dependent oxidoreductase